MKSRFFSEDLNDAGDAEWTDLKRQDLHSNALLIFPALATGNDVTREFRQLCIGDCSNRQICDRVAQPKISRSGEA